MTLHRLLDSPDTPGLPRGELEKRFAKLTKINAALMQRVERSMEQQGNAYSLFQTAIGLEEQVRLRTDELKAALLRLEKSNEELAGARDAAELANRLKTRFFTAVGHDLLQPLHAARLTLSAMNGADGGDGESGLHRQIDHALSTIEDLLKTILDLSKLEAGIVTPSLQPIHLTDLFQSLVVEFGPMARKKDIELSCVCGDLAVVSDPLMLRRMIQNLLVNAVHYTERGGVRLLARRRGGDVRIEVWDTGPGIPAGESKRIFEEFQRGSASEQARRGGMGLGLSIVQRMAAALGHEIALCSRVGKGTRLSILAPAAHGAAQAASASALTEGGRAYGFDGAAIVMVENDEAGMEAMTTLLDRWGCRTRGVRDLSQVRELADEASDFRPELILADYHLDRRECGLSAVATLREAWGGDIPAVIVTADHSTRIAEETRDAGCELLCKPVKPAELRAVIGYLLGKDKASAD